MFAIQSNIVWFFIFIHVSNCQRRIENGMIVEGQKPYVVYIVKAPMSKILYDSWLCGGALVTTDLVVTSAACIKDVDYLHVIAGYNKYVTDQEIELDPCTSKKKKKVIYTCYPEGYELKYDRLDKWSFIDIGVAKVESPYDFTDQSYKTICSYIPSTIPINTEDKYQRPGLDAIVLGWGHKSIWRKPEDNKNYNQRSLNYASVIIINKRDCRSHYEEHGRMTDVITKYMICTLGNGGIDEFGVQLPTEPSVFPYGCSRRKSLGNNTDAELEDCEYDYEDETRRVIKKPSNVTKTTVEANITTEPTKRDSTKSIPAMNKRTQTNRKFTVTDRTPLLNRTYLTNKTHHFDETVRNTRRNGFCQNDHGGPLVTWVGSHEILIGVASVFKVSQDYLCEGPYLYTSTQCNGAFLDCILDKTDFNNLSEEDDYYRRSLKNVTYNESRRSYCRKSPNDKRHLTTERFISWKNHPAGPADNERHLMQGKNKPSVKEQLPVKNEENMNKNKISISQVNEQYSPIQYNQKSSVNGDHDPNKKYIFNKNIAPTVNQRGASNNEYLANYQSPLSDRPKVINNISPYNGPAPNNGPATNKGLAVNVGQASNNGAAPNNGAASNNAPGQANGPALNYGPSINYKSEPSNDHVLRKGPGLNTNFGRINNNYALNNGPALVISPKPVYKSAASNKPKMRPTLPFRI